jgi:DNA-binding HxlR family transcriptional regulator
MSLKKKKISARGPGVYRKLEDVIGCKWSVSVLLSIGAGVNRPGSLERHIDGISTKVLSERLRKLTSYGLLEKRSFAEVPPRTEYSLTPSGRDLVRIIQQIHALDSELAGRETGK